ncbi:hypothetical protein JXB12_00515 [candidate division KSB1 bacterium]|nr:hypothetical protein [candidate division KSB1 bacterium]
MELKKQFDLIFKNAEYIIYLLVGVLLIITAFYILFQSLITIIDEFADAEYIHAVLHMIDRILLTMMIVEILYTVRVSLKSHSLCAEPFLIVGLIAAIRRILLISVESAYLLEKFKYHIIEIGVLGVIIFIFVCSIVMLRKEKQSL